MVNLNLFSSIFRFLFGHHHAYNNNASLNQNIIYLLVSHQTKKKKSIEENITKSQKLHKTKLKFIYLKKKEKLINYACML
jgi:hypothetical protein